MVERRREAATSIEALIAGLRRAPEVEAEPSREWRRCGAELTAVLDPAASDKEATRERGGAITDAREFGERAAWYRRSNQSPRPLVWWSPLPRRRRGGRFGGSAGCPRGEQSPGEVASSVDRGGRRRGLAARSSRVGSRASRQHHAAGARCRVVRAPAHRDSGSRSPGPGAHGEHRIERDPDGRARRRRGVDDPHQAAPAVLGARGCGWPHGCAGSSSRAKTSC